MRCARALLLAAALLGVAGCQTDMEMRHLNRTGAYAASVWDTEGLAWESDTRRVTLDFERPPVGHIVDSDTYIAYISVPVHPKRGLIFTDPSFGVGWSDVAMSVGGIFELTPGKLPYDKRVKVVPDDIIIDMEKYSNGIGDNWSPVDPRYEAYAKLLREHLYRIDFAGAVDEHERTAEAPATPPATAGAPALREND